MAAHDIAAALQRAEAVLRRRPDVGLHDDPPASVRWSGGLRFVAGHASGRQVVTDMPTELGGSGDQITPGWLFRAGFATCTATLIAMVAAEQGIALESLEVLASSRSDARALLGMAEADGVPVHAGPSDVQALVRISAHGVAAPRLRALVEEGFRRSPMACAFQSAVPVALRIEVNAA